MIWRTLEGLVFLLFCIYSANGQSSLVECSKDSPIMISFNNSDAQELGRTTSNDLIVISRTPLSSLTGVSQACRQTNENSGFAFNLNECDPYIEMNSTFILFTWTFRIVLDTTETVLRINETSKNISCAYNRTQLASSKVVDPLLRQVLVGSVNAQGAFALSLNLFNDDSFGTQLNSGDSIMVNEIIYSRISINTALVNTSRFIVQMRTCWSTTTNNPSSSPRYDLISNSCPANSFVNVTRNYEAQNGTFQVSAFVWTTNFSLPIYIHCSVGVCDLADTSASCSNPNMNCPATRRRKRRDIDDRILSYGPINIVPYVPASQCEENNGGCSDICSVKNNKVLCSCPFGSTLLSDGKRCSAVAESYMSETFINENSPLLIAALVMVVVCLLVSIVFFFTNRKKGVKGFTKSHI